MDPAMTLQQAIVPRLQADATVAAIIADRVYDRVPDEQPENAEDGWPFPYVTVPDVHVVGEHGFGYEGAEAYPTIHCWSRMAGAIEAKRLGAAVAAALHGAALDLDGHRLVELVYETSHYMLDKDGLTTHGVIMFKALTDFTD